MTLSLLRLSGLVGPKAILGKTYIDEYSHYVSMTKDALQSRLETIENCDVKNLTPLVMSYSGLRSYAELTDLELSYMLWRRCDSGFQVKGFVEYESFPKYIPHNILKDMSRYPSKYPMISYQLIQMIVQELLETSTNKTIELLLEGDDLKSKTMADFRRIFISFMTPLGNASLDDDMIISDREIDLCFHLGWIMWSCYGEKWHNQYKNIVKSYMNLNEEELETLRDQVCHLYFGTHNYGCGRRVKPLGSIV
jgi:hypothetical protein